MCFGLLAANQDVFYLFLEGNFIVNTIIIFVTGPTKIGHVVTNYILSHNRMYLSTGVKYLLFCTKQINY